MMSPESRAFLELVRDAEEPDPNAEQRVLAAVRATVAAVGAAAATDTARRAEPMPTGAVAPFKLGVLGVWLLAGGLIVMPAPAPDESPADRTSAGVPAAPALAARAESLAARRASVPAASLAHPTAAPPEPQPKPRAAPRARVRAAAAPASLRDELELLAQVQAALRRGDAATALRQLDEHRTLDVQLRSEREAARALALCSLGRATEGRRVRAELLQREPSSPHRSALERACLAEE